MSIIVRKSHRLIAVALGVIGILPVAGQMQWERRELAGEQICQNRANGEIYNPLGYAAKNTVTIFCKILTEIGWLGVQAQPAGVPVLVLSNVQGATVGRLSFEARGAIPVSSNDPYSDDDSDPDEAVYPQNAFDPDFEDRTSLRTLTADAATTGATVRVRATTNQNGRWCMFVDQRTAGNRGAWMTGSFTDQGDDAVMDERTGQLGDRFCQNADTIAGVETTFAGNCNTTCTDMLMYQPFFVEAWLGKDYANAQTPQTPIPGSISFNPSSFPGQAEISVLQFALERTGGNDGTCTATIAEGNNPGSITLNTTMLSWADNEDGFKFGTVDLLAVGSDTTSTLTMTATCGTGGNNIASIEIINGVGGCSGTVGGCVHFTFATASCDESTTVFDRARHTRDQSDPTMSGAASVEVYLKSGGTCPGGTVTLNNYPYPPGTEWGAGQEGNRHVEMSCLSVSATCTQLLGLRNASGTAVDSVLFEKTLTVNDVATPPSGDCDFYFSPTGSAGNPGTEGSPWTLAKANSTLVAGQTACALAGTYEDRINPVSGGTPSAKIIFRPKAGVTARIQGTNTPGEPAVSVFTDYVVVEGFEIWQDDQRISGGQEYQHTIEFYGDHDEFRGNTVINPTWPASFPQATMKMWADGVWLTAMNIDANDMLIENNIIRGVIWGISLRADHGNGFRNIIRNNDIGPLGGDGIVLGSSFGAIQGVLIENNTLHDSVMSDGVQSNDFDGDGDDACGFIIRNNVIRDNGENGIDLKGSCRAYVYGNTIYANRGDNDGTVDPAWLVGGAWLGPDVCDNEDPLACSPDAGGGSQVNLGTSTLSSNSTYRHNVFYDGAGGIGRVRPTWLLLNNTIVSNRRLYSGPNQTSGYPGVWDIATGGGGKNNLIVDHQFENLNVAVSSFDHNIYWNCFQTPQFGYRQTPPTYANLATWVARAISGNVPNPGDPPGSDGDNNSIVANPLFVNAPCGLTKDTPSLNFGLQAGSPARNTGQAPTTTNGSGSGTVIRVFNSNYFHYGFGVTTGDIISVGNDTNLVITNINYATHDITVNSSINWNNGDAVNFWPYYGTAPDKGAIEYVE